MSVKEASMDEIFKVKYLKTVMDLTANKKPGLSVLCFTQLIEPKPNGRTVVQYYLYPKDSEFWLKNITGKSEEIDHFLSVFKHEVHVFVCLVFKKEIREGVQQVMDHMYKIYSRLSGKDLTAELLGKDVFSVSMNSSLDY